MATMEDLVASVKDIKFDIETYIEHQVGIQPLPFLGMDSKYHLASTTVCQHPSCCAVYTSKDFNKDIFVSGCTRHAHQQAKASKA